MRTFKRNGTPIPEDPISSTTTSSFIGTYFTTTQQPFYNTTFCYEICSTTQSNDDLITSTDLLENLLMKITTTLPTIFELINNKTTESFDTLLNYTTITDYFVNNVTDEYYDTNVTTEFNYNYTDYLFINRLISKIVNDSLTFDNWNLTSTTLNYNDTFDEFKTSLTPYLNVTNFESETTNKILTTIYEEITSTSSVEDVQSTTASSNCEIICESEATSQASTTTFTPLKLTTISDNGMNYTTRSRLRSLCWETMFGQELVKLTVMDLVMMVASTLAMDFFRGIAVRYLNKCWCWDLEKKFPQYGDFKVAENILHLVNNQGNVWMGMFFSPGIALINVVKLYATMYLRSWAVLTCNVPHEVIFRASRSNNFYFALLLLMLFLCVLPVGYAIVWVEPSWHCGPFSNYPHIFKIFTITLRKVTPKSLEKALDYIASPGTIIPLLVLLILIIYYLVSLTNALREANNELKAQLRKERTVERRKMFQIADRRRRGGSEGSNEGQNPFVKWKKLLQTFPSGKSLDDTPKDSELVDDAPQEDRMDPDKKGNFY